MDGTGVDPGVDPGDGTGVDARGGTGRGIGDGARVLTGVIWAKCGRWGALNAPSELPGICPRRSQSAGVPDVIALIAPAPVTTSSFSLF